MKNFFIELNQGIRGEGRGKAYHHDPLLGKQDYLFNHVSRKKILDPFARDT
jgi:hypothetical protein